MWYCFFFFIPSSHPWRSRYGTQEVHEMFSGIYYFVWLSVGSVVDFCAFCSQGFENICMQYWFIYFLLYFKTINIIIMSFCVLFLEEWNWKAPVEVCVCACMSVCLCAYPGTLVYVCVCMCLGMCVCMCMLNKNKPDKRVYMSLVLISECGTEVMVTEIEKVCDWVWPKTSEYIECMESFKNCKLTSFRPLCWIFWLFQSFQEPSQSLSSTRVRCWERHTERAAERMTKLI